MYTSSLLDTDELKMILRAFEKWTPAGFVKLTAFVDFHDQAHSKSADINQGRTGYYIQISNRRKLGQLTLHALLIAAIDFDVLSQFLEHFLSNLFECLSLLCQLASGIYYIVKIRDRQRYDLNVSQCVVVVFKTEYSKGKVNKNGQLAYYKNTTDLIS